MTNIVCAIAFMGVCFGDNGGCDSVQWVVATVSHFGSGSGFGWLGFEKRFSLFEKFMNEGDKTIVKLTIKVSWSHTGSSFLLVKNFDL